MEPMDTSESPPDQPNKFVQRRRHLKSRNGCTECKKRKVKCDESRELNSCGACLRRGTRCSFKPPTPPPSVHATPSPSPSFGSNILDLELLHNYSSKTCRTMTGHHGNDLQTFHRTVFITEALKSSYSLHFLLSFSAYHLAHEHYELLKTAPTHKIRALISKREQYLAAASSHHNAGLSAFRQGIADLNEQNCHSIVPATALVVNISFAQLCDGVRLASESVVDDPTAVTRWNILLRGMKDVCVGHWQWLIDGPMAILFMGPQSEKDFETNIAALPGDVVLYLDRLCFTFTHHSEPGISHACIAAVEMLRTIWNGFANGSDFGAVFLWAVRVPDSYMALLEAKKSEALLVLGAYCVLLHSGEWFWWIQGWPRNMLRMIEDLLEEKWKSWLEWPIMMVQDPDKIQLKKKLLVVTEGRCCA